MRPVLSLVLGTILAGCSLVAKPSPEELAALEAPPPGIAREVDRLTPKALNWIAQTARSTAATGRQLSADEAAYAAQIGVARPESVRVVVTDEFPMPQDPELRRAVEAFGMGSAHEGGRTLGHVIFIKPNLAGSRTVVSHELNHVAQFDRFGDEGMVRRYMTELLSLGYARSPLELEAYEKQLSILPI